MAGRPKADQLYRKKNSPNWLYYRKGFGTVDTGTQDRYRAEAMLKAALSNQAPVDFDAPEQTTVRSALERLADTLPAGQGSAMPAPTVDNVSAYPHTMQEPQAPVQTVLTPNGPKPLLSDKQAPTSTAPTTPNPVSLGAVATDTKSKALEQLKRRLTPGRREKLLGVMAGGVARVNALAQGLALSVGGYKLPDNYVVTDDDLEVMKVGYEMGIDELLANADPEWWHLVIMGNLTLLATSVPHLEKKSAKPLPPIADSEPTDGNGN